MIQTRTKKLSILLTLYLVVFLNSLGYFLIIPTLTELITSPTHGLISTHFMHTFGDYVFGVVLGAGSLSGIAFAPILGRLSDRIGRKKTLLLCTGLTLISMILPIIGILNSSIVIFMLGNIINGISSNDQPIAQAAITDISPIKNNKAMRFSIDTFVICLAMTTGPLAGTLLSDHHIVHWFNHTTPFLAGALLTLIALLLLLFVLPETNPYAEKQLHIDYKDSLSSFADIFKLPPFVYRLLFVFFCAQTAWAQFFQYLYLYLSPVRHFSESQVAWYTGLIGIYFSIGLLIIYPILLRLIPMRRSVSSCIFTALVSMLVIAAIHNHWALWLAVIPLCWGMGMYFPSLLTLFSDNTSAKDQGWIMAIATSLIGIAWFLTGFSAIFLKHFGSSTPLWVSAFLLLISWLVMHHDNRLQRTTQSLS